MFRFAGLLLALTIAPWSGAIVDDGSSGVSVKAAQDLARHSTSTLRIDRYAHTRLYDVQGALVWPDALIRQWENWVCGENENLLRSPGM